MCGIFGIHAPERDVARLAYVELFALQNRGQESAGIAVGDGRRVLAQKDLGLVPQVFDEPSLAALQGHVAIGHTRYSTTGSARWPNAQPIVRHRPGRTIALAHNGNLTNTAALRDELTARGIVLETTSDTEVIAALICAHEGPLEESVREAMDRIEGAFSAVVLDGRQVVGFRDAVGIRPLVLGDLDGSPVLASETCALDIVGARAVQELEPGQLAVLDDDGVRIEQALAPRRGDPALCIFEHIYLARPDSTLDGVGLHGARRRMGERLAAEAPVDADVVIGVPDSGTPAAQGFAAAAGLPYADGLVKNRYVGRTFIEPDQAMREHAVQMKFNPLPDVVAGRRVAIVDDSVVRGSTTRKIVAMLRAAGALEVHVRVSSPPVVSPCYYGIDMATEQELLAAGRTLDEVRAAIGADSLAYLSLDGLQAATSRGAERFCRACLTGRYPTGVPGDAADKERFEQARPALRVVQPV